MKDVEKAMGDLGRELIREAERDGNVVAVILFGSRARGEAADGSDLDICLVLREGVTDKKIPFREALKYTGLARGGNVDVSIFRELPLFVRARVLKEGKVLLSKNDEMLYGIAFRTVKDFEEFKKYYYQYLGAVTHAR